LAPRPLSELQPGDTARVQSFLDPEVSLKLIEMGCIPGIEIRFIRRAPLGDPLAFQCLGSIISIRKREAATVMVEER
jgi:ferrous iron transport protein A